MVVLQSKSKLYIGSLPEVVREVGVSGVGDLEELSHFLMRGLDKPMLIDFGCITRRGFIYLPNGEVLLVRESPILASEDVVEEAVRNWKSDKEYSLDQPTLDAYLDQEKADAEKPLRERRVFRLENYELPIKWVVDATGKRVIESKSIKAREGYAFVQPPEGLGRWLYEGTKMSEVRERRKAKDFGVIPIAPRSELEVDSTKPFTRLLFFSIYHLTCSTGQGYQDCPRGSHIVGCVPYVNDIPNEFVVRDH